MRKSCVHWPGSSLPIGPLKPSNPHPALHSDHPCGPQRRPCVLRETRSQRFPEASQKAKRTQICTAEQSQHVGQGNSIQLCSGAPVAEQPCDREERTLSWVQPCLLAKRALRSALPLSKRPHRTTGPSSSLGMGVGEGLLHPALEETGGGRATSGKATGSEWLQG